MAHRTQSHVHARQARAERERAHAYDKARRRDNGRNLYKTAAWRNLRAKKISECPVCTCGAPATVVDHRTPHRGSNALFFDEGNLDALCKRCHDRKTARHDGGFGRAARHTPRTDEGFGMA